MLNLPLRAPFEMFEKGQFTKSSLRALFFETFQKRQFTESTLRALFFEMFEKG